MQKTIDIISSLETTSIVLFMLFTADKEHVFTDEEHEPGKGCGDKERLPEPVDAIAGVAPEGESSDSEAQDGQAPPAEVACGALHFAADVDKLHAQCMRAEGGFVWKIIQLCFQPLCLSEAPAAVERAECEKEPRQREGKADACENDSAAEPWLALEIKGNADL